MAPRPLTGAGGSNRAAVRFDEFVDDRQADAEAAHAAHLFAFGLRKPFEHVRQELRVDAATGVLHDEVDTVPVRRDRERDLSARGRELHAVRQQVPYDLPEPVRVAGNPAS